MTASAPGQSGPGSQSPARFVRPELRELKAYHLDQVECVHKLDQNEVPWDLPRRLKEEVARRLLERDWARYPDFHSDELRRDLAERHGHPMEGVLVGNGSNELLGIALEALVAAGTGVLGAEPGFGLYPMFVLRAGGRYQPVPPADDLSLPLEALRAHVERDPRRPLILCTPNNPTGAAVSPEEVAELAEALDAPLLLDNAYGEFCEHDYRPLLANHPNLLLFRTFSKAWSLAGLRLGYLLAHPDLINELIKVKLPYNLGHGTAVAGRVALEAESVTRRRVAAIIGRRPQWAEMFESFGLDPVPSQANFLLVRCGSPERSGRIRDGLAERGILVRKVGHYPGLSGCLRVSVGSGVALRDTRAALEQISKGEG